MTIRVLFLLVLTLLLSNVVSASRFDDVYQAINEVQAPSVYDGDVRIGTYLSGDRSGLTSLNILASKNYLFKILINNDTFDSYLASPRLYFLETDCNGTGYAPATLRSPVGTKASNGFGFRDIRNDNMMYIQKGSETIILEFYSYAQPTTPTTYDCVSASLPEDPPIEVEVYEILPNDPETTGIPNSISNDIYVGFEQ